MPVALYDRLENLAANLATGTAKTAGDVFGLRAVPPTELTAMYRGDWISRKIVDLPVTDAVRPWRTWQVDTDLVTAIEDAERAHQVRAKVAQAFKWARLYGGAAILVSNGDRDPSKPLTGVRRGGLQCLTVLQRHEVQPLNTVDDPRSPVFRAPEYYQLGGAGWAVQVHHSRVIRFLGPERPDVDTNPEGWGDSILQIVYDAVHHAALTNAAIAELVHDAKVDVIQVEGLSKALQTTAGTDTVTRRFQLANTLKSLNNMLLLGEGETWERKQTSFAALPDILQTYMQIVAGAADIPATRLLGQSPKGLGSTGEGDLTNYYDHLAGWREDELRPVLERIDTLLWQHIRGTPPPGAWWQFSPLRQMTESQTADIAAKKAETTRVYANMGVFSEEELREIVTGQLVEDGTYPGLEAALDPLRSAGDGPGADPAPQDPASLDRAIRRYREGLGGRAY